MTYFSIEYLPSMNQDISVAPLLKGHEAEFLQSGPVIQFMTAMHATSKVSRDTLNGFYISDLVRIPNRATVFQLIPDPHHCFEESKH